MKKALHILLILALLIAMAVPTCAAGPEVIFTADSSPKVGCTLTIDKGAMLTHESNTAETYNAMLEGNVIYSWYKNGALHCEGIDTDSILSSSYTLQEEDLGSLFYVKVTYYEDSTFTTQCGQSVSDEMRILSDRFPVPTITTQALPDATVGTAYSVKVECADPDAVYSEIMGSQLSEFGLVLTQHGEIEGTPTKAGNCHVNILTEGYGGEDSIGLDITVKEPVTTPDQTPENDPTAAPTTAPTDPGTPGAPKDPPRNNWWIYVAVAAAAMLLGVGAALLLVKKKK